MLTVPEHELISQLAVTALVILISSHLCFLAAVSSLCLCPRRPLARATACMVIAFYLPLPGPRVPLR